MTTKTEGDEMPVYEIRIEADEEIEAENEQAAEDEVRRWVRNGDTELEYTVKEYKPPA